ncbi:MAG: CusA/CzcA family heavy metal efflux RND transporter, partial [Chitinophagaceae bacterium]
TYPVEIAMQNIQGLTNMRSISQFALSLITLEFEDNVDIYFVRNQILERLQHIDIDPSFGKPEMLPITTGLGEIYQYVIKPKNPEDTSWTPMELRTVQDWIVKKKLLGTKGIVEISSFGGYKKQYHVSVDPMQLKANNVNLQEVYNAVSQSNINTGASYMEKEGRNYFIRGIGLLQEPKDLENVVIKMNGNVPVLVKNIGEVKEGYAIRYGAMTQNGKEAVGGIVMMLKGANTYDALQNVKERLEAIQPILPQGLVIEPFLDRQELINSTIQTVTKNLIEGGLIVIFILVLLLGHWQAGIIVASVIPLSMLFAICMMVLFGVSGNLMSLGAIDFGLIVDGAVIIVENVVRILNKRLYKNKNEAVFVGASKMVQSSIFGQIVILVVYFPLLTLSGIEGKMFHPMVITVMFALLGALMLSLTFVPMMSSLLLKSEKQHKENFSDKLIKFLTNLYVPVLKVVLYKKKLMLGIAIAFLILAFYLFQRMGGEFIPQLDEGDYALAVKMPPGTSLTEMINVSHIVSQKIKNAFPDEVKGCIGKIGTSEIPTDPMSIEEEDMVISMYPKEQWKKAKTRQEFESQLEEVCSFIPGVFFSLQQPINMRFNELMTGAKSDVIIRVSGNDLEKLAKIGNEILNIVEKIPGAKDVVMAKAEGLPQLYITFNREALSRYGLTMREVNNILQMALAGKYATTYLKENQRFDILVKLDKQVKNSFTEIENIQVLTPIGAIVPLKELATIEFQKGPMAVFRTKGIRNVNVSLNIRDRDVATVVEEVQKDIKKKIKLPSGYEIAYGGQFENLKNASDRLMIVVPLSLGIILLLLYLSFHSLKDMFIISTAIPFAAIGGVFSLWIRDMPFSISAGVGFIALFGVAVLNGIVLIAYFNELKNNYPTHLSLNTRIIKGVTGRFRAVLMTAMVASMGFIPMAFGSGAGSEVQRPLATVVIGGLISSTMLTLLMLPAIYKIVYSIKRKKIPLSKCMILFLVVGLYICCSTHHLYAQDTTSKRGKIIAWAIKNNPTIKEYELKKKQAKVMKNTTFNLPNPVANAEFYNKKKLAADNFSNIIFSLDETIEFPTTYIYRGKMLNTQYDIATTNLEIIQKLIAKKTEQFYNEYLFAIAKRKSLHRYDSFFYALQKISVAEYQAGAINELSKLNLSAKQQQIYTKHQVAILEEERTKKNLKNFIIDTIGFIDTIVQSDSLYALKIDFSPDQNPSMLFVELSNKNILLRKRETQYILNQQFPNISVGVRTDPTIIPKNTLFGFTAGITIPIFLWNNMAQVKAADLAYKAEIKRSEQMKLNIKMWNENLYVSFENVKSELKYYKENVVPQIHRMNHMANMSYLQGGITILEYLFTVSQTIDMELNYYDILKRYNNIVAEITYGGGME